jgi:hypothetical protein
MIFKYSSKVKCTGAVAPRVVRGMFSLGGQGFDVAALTSAARSWT